MKKPRRRGAKSEYIGSHVRLYHWELKSLAFRSLSVGARALLIDLKALYNGTNNGGLFLSVREAGKRLGVAKDTASKYLRELELRGFVKAREHGHFSMKSASRRGQATTWTLTEYGVGDAIPTKDFMHWRPEDHSTVPNPWHAVRVTRTRNRKTEQTVPSRETESERTAI
jgi:hypothetical protein